LSMVLEQTKPFVRENRYPIFPKPCSNSSVCRPKDLFQPGAYG
jgi:hypothetical protein